MRLNLGCGFDRRDGYVNVDNQPLFEPDILAELEVFPWPFESNAASKILLSHVLEHLGERRETYFQIIQELYRVSAPGAEIEITVPHPRNDDFLMDPTHVRPIIAEQFFMFSKKKTREWRNRGAANTPLADILGVDFDVLEVQSVPDDFWLGKLKRGEISSEDLALKARYQVNIIKEVTIQLIAIK